MAEHNLDDFSVNRASLTIDRDVLERVNTVRHLSHAAPLRAVVASLFFAQASATSKQWQKRDWSQTGSGNNWTPPPQPERTFDRCAYFHFNRYACRLVDYICSQQQVPEDQGWR